MSERTPEKILLEVFETMFRTYPQMKRLLSGSEKELEQYYRNNFKEELLKKLTNLNGCVLWTNEQRDARQCTLTEVKQIIEEL